MLRIDEADGLRLAEYSRNYLFLILACMVVACAFALLTTACGGGAATPIPPIELTTIMVTPAVPSISVGGTQSFTATGTYSDNSTKNLTTSVTWSSADATVATISSQGVAAGASVGSTLITGASGSINGSTTLTVNAAVSKATWSQRGPVARFSHTAVFDPTTQSTIIFGGQQTSDSTNLNDVWLSSTSISGDDPDTYTLLQPTGTAPAPRSGHVSTYDSNTNRMTVFGGAEGAAPTCGNDVWILDGANGQSAGASWLPITASGTAPAARVLHTGVYDPVANTLTIFGGSNCNGAFFNDVWVLSNANGEGGTSAWTKLAPSGSLPPARESSTATYDPTNHVLTVYGGDAGGTAFGDVWVLSNANGQGGAPVWTQLSPTGTTPLARTGHTAIYDSVNDCMTIFGGFDSFAGDTTFGDAWVLTFANGIGGTPAWTLLPVQGTAPDVGFHTAVYNPALNSMYVFAGTSTGTKLQTSNHLFTLSNANNLDSDTPQWYIAGPPVRYSHSAFYDTTTGSLFIYAGQHSSNITYGDYFRDDGVTTPPNLAWSKPTVSGVAPGPRFGHTGLYDPTSNTMMVFGGGTGSPGPCVNDYSVLQQANGVGGSATWVPLTPTGTAPAARYRQAAAYDGSSNSLIIFGGSDCGSTYFNDVWRLSNANDSSTPAWTHVLPTGTAPSQREASSAIYDSATNSMIVFGGEDGSTVFGDLWVLSNANGTGGTPAWTQLTASGSGPAPRGGHTAVYDSQNSRMIVYGGVSGGTVFNDTWILSNANSVGGTPTWTVVSPATPGPPRYYHTAAYDPGSNEMIIFGGVISTNPFSPDANVFTLSDANGLQ